MLYARTVDLISYRITRLGNHPSVVEAAAGSGDLCGSTFLDRAFAAWLNRRFSHLREWRDWHLPDAMEKWMEIKKGYDGDTDKTWAVPLRGLLDDAQLRLRNGIFELTGGHVRRVFEPVIQRVLTLVQSQITESQRGNPKAVKAVLLAGGFGNNPYLKARIQQAVGNAIIVDKMDHPYEHASYLLVFSETLRLTFHPAKLQLFAERCSKGLLVINQIPGMSTSRYSHEKLAIILASPRWSRTTRPSMILEDHGEIIVYHPQDAKFAYNQENPSGFPGAPTEVSVLK